MEKPSGLVRTEALRMARNIIKLYHRAAGKHISEIEPITITRAARDYIKDHPELLKAAKKSIDSTTKLAETIKVH